MARLNHESRKPLLTGLLLGMLCGFTAGVISCTLLVSHKIDRYQETISQLETAILNKDMQLRTLQEKTHTREPILRAVHIHLIFSGDPLERSSLEKQLQELYRPLLGKRVGAIDFEMVEQIANRRIVQIANRQYQLTTTKIVLADRLTVWIEATTLPRAP